MDKLISFQSGAIVFLLVGSTLWWSAFQIKSMSKHIAFWSLVGYSTLLFGNVMKFLGVNRRLLNSLIGGLWELCIGGWHIVRKF